MRESIRSQTNRTEPARREGVAWARLPVALLGTAAAATAANALLYLGASALGAISKTLPMPSMLGVAPLSLAPVLLTSVVVGVAAVAVYALVSLLARRPVRAFRITATVLFLLSLLSPATYPGVPPAMRLVLAAMHVAAWAAAVWLLPALARATPR
jgi:hypothetical protein